MGIFDRFSRSSSSNINDLISPAEDPEKMLNADPRRHARQLVKAKQQVAVGHRRREAPARPGRRRVQAGRRTGSEAPMLAIQEGRDDLAKQALVRQAEHAQHAQQLAADVGGAPARDGEAQELAARPERQDRGGEAQEEPAPRPAAPRAGAAAHRRDDVVAVREERVRGVRADGGAHRARTSGRSRRRAEIDEEFTRRHACSASSSSSRRARRRCRVDNAAARAQAEDGHAARRRLPRQSKALGAGQA